MLTTANKIVHGMWVGSTLSSLELLTLRSFTDRGHVFRLWTYGRPDMILPSGVELMDAQLIIPAEQVFSYQKGNQFGHGKGSYAGFSDIFRYKLLYETGGWWVDMDMTCLRPLEFEAPYVFRPHDVLPVVGNLMKCPQGSPLMWDCYTEAVDAVDQYNTDWLKPIVILNENIEKHHLTSYIVPHLSNADRWEVVDFYRSYPAAIPEKYYVFHWMNEEWRSRGLDKGLCCQGAALDRLMEKHHIQVKHRPPHNHLQFALKWVLFFLIPLVPRPIRLVAKTAYVGCKKSLFIVKRQLLALIPQKWKISARKHLLGKPANS